MCIRDRYYIDPPISSIFCFFFVSKEGFIGRSRTTIEYGRQNNDTLGVNRLYLSIYWLSLYSIEIDQKISFYSPLKVQARHIIHRAWGDKEKKEEREKNFFFLAQAGLAYYIELFLLLLFAHCVRVVNSKWLLIVESVVSSSAVCLSDSQTVNQIRAFLALLSFFYISVCFGNTFCSEIYKTK